MFSQLLQSALVSTIVGPYADFRSVARAALSMVAQRRGRELANDEVASILGTIVELPPYPEVARGSSGSLRAGIGSRRWPTQRPASPRPSSRMPASRRASSGILSAADARRLKPAPEAYRYAAAELGVDASQLRLVAAHAWDVAGALGAGCLAAFVARPGMVLAPLAPRPDIIGADLESVAHALL